MPGLVGVKRCSWGGALHVDTAAAGRWDVTVENGGVIFHLADAMTTL
jgi:hypothetical protein